MNKREKFGVDKEAKVKDVKKHWQQTALAHHPDQGGNVENFMHQQQLYKAALKEASEPIVCSECKGKKKIKKTVGFNTVEITCPLCKNLANK